MATGSATKNKEDKNKIDAKRNPISKELTATKSYAQKLSKLYGKYITLSPDAVYKGASVKMSFFCNLCQGTTSAKASVMLKGTRCQVCRTTPEHLHLLEEHKSQFEYLRQLAPNVSRFQLAVDPIKFSLKSKYYYKCTKCEGQIYARPQEALETTCVACENAGERLTYISLYRQRLNMMYLMTIERVGEFSLTHPILHMCNVHKGFSWFATVSDMLSGHGCPRCGPIKFKTIEPVAISGKTFILQNKTEVKVLRALKNQNYLMSDVLTRFQYPIPVTFGKHTPALYIKSTNTIVEAVSSVEKIKERMAKIVKSRDLLRDLGFRYVLAVMVGKKAVEFRETHNLSVTTKKIRQVSIPRSVPKTKRMASPVPVTEVEKKERAKVIRKEKLKELKQRKSMENKIAPHLTTSERAKRYLHLLKEQAKTSTYSAKMLEATLRMLEERANNVLQVTEAPPFDV